MKQPVKRPAKRGKLSLPSRRAFLRGAGSVAVGLPFLEGLPERSAWAQDEAPVFIFFICGANGVVADQFWPSAHGALTTAGMREDGKAVSALADHAANLLIVDGVEYPGRLSNCGHAQGLVQALTGVGPSGGGQTAQSTGISADMVISASVNPSGVDPLTLYSGRKSYIAERLSFNGAGNARSAEGNPFNVYRQLIGLATDEPETVAVVDQLLLRRQSVNDLVRDDLRGLLSRTDLSMADRTRLDAHLTAVRDIEDGVMAMATEGCATTGLDLPAILALEDFSFSQNGHMIEDLVRLHSELVAFAFACNANRVATLQWGDGTDATIYDVPSNSRRWSFHHVSHRLESDKDSGNDATAEAAHAEIDVLRMQTFRHTLDHLSERGLLERCAVLWTNHVADGPTHSFQNLPYLIAGNAGGYLRQGEYLNASGTYNGAVLNTLIAASGATGSVGKDGQLDAIRV